MRNLGRRVIAPAVLISAGFAAIGYAVLGNVVPIVEESETTETITIQPFGPPEAADFPFGPPGFGPPGFDQPPPFKPLTEQVTRKIKTVKEEPEYVLVREVTFGGVTLANGVLKRTYSGKAPSLCPT